MIFVVNLCIDDVRERINVCLEANHIEYIMHGGDYLCMYMDQDGVVEFEIFIADNRGGTEVIFNRMLGDGFLYLRVTRQIYIEFNPNDKLTENTYDKNMPSDNELQQLLENVTMDTIVWDASLLNTHSTFIPTNMGEILRIMFQYINTIRYDRIYLLYTIGNLIQQNRLHRTLRDTCISVVNLTDVTEFERHRINHIVNLLST